MMTSLFQPLKLEDDDNIISVREVQVGSLFQSVRSEDDDHCFSL
jgi:hypothetical protein